MIRTFHSRFSTDQVELFAIGMDGAAATALDLLKMMDQAVRAKLKKTRDADDYVFSLPGGTNLKLGNTGLVRGHVMMWPGAEFYRHGPGHAGVGPPERTRDVDRACPATPLRPPEPRKT